VFSSFFLLFISGEAIILGFQHYILALGTAVMIPTVLVPMMGGDDVSFLCHAAFRFLTTAPAPCRQHRSVC
jgi:hypothetical protein